MRICKGCKRKVDPKDCEDAGHWIYDGCRRWCRGPLLQKNVTKSVKGLDFMGGDIKKGGKGGSKGSI